jgi:hypothetical protein
MQELYVPQEVWSLNGGVSLWFCDGDQEDLNRRHQDQGLERKDFIHTVHDWVVELRRYKT